MNLKTSLITTIALSILGLTFWELYRRAKPKYYTTFPEDNRNLWAEERLKVETATSRNIILKIMTSYRNIHYPTGPI